MKGMDKLTPTPSVEELSEKLTEAQRRLNDRQHSLMLSFWDAHDEGVKSPPYFKAFGISRLTLGGEGQALVGLIRRGFVEERNNLFYVTPLGLAIRNRLIEGETSCTKTS